VNLKGPVCRGCSPSQRASNKSNTASLHQLKIPTPIPSPPAEPLKNAPCPIARESLCSLVKAFPKASADQAATSTSEGSVPERKSPKPIRRCHRLYCHLVCSDLVGTPSKTAWGPHKAFKLRKHSKLCWLRPTEVSFWKPGSQKSHVSQSNTVK